MQNFGDYFLFTLFKYLIVCYLQVNFFKLNDNILFLIIFIFIIIQFDLKSQKMSQIIPLQYYYYSYIHTNYVITFNSIIIQSITQIYNSLIQSILQHFQLYLFKLSNQTLFIFRNITTSNTILNIIPMLPNQNAKITNTTYSFHNSNTLDYFQSGNPHNMNKLTSNFSKLSLDCIGLFSNNQNNWNDFLVEKRNSINQQIQKKLRSEMFQQLRQKNGFLQKSKQPDIGLEKKIKMRLSTCNLKSLEKEQERIEYQSLGRTFNNKIHISNQDHANIHQQFFFDNFRSDDRKQQYEYRMQQQNEQLNEQQCYQSQQEYQIQQQEEQVMDDCEYFMRIMNMRLNIEETKEDRQMKFEQT